MSKFSFSKGKLAEKMISEMMAEMGFRVAKFGYEHLFPKLANRRKLLKGDIGHKIRSQPDFLIVNPKNMEANFVEVKYRANGEISERHLEKNLKHYPESWVVMVSQRGIHIASSEYMRDNPTKEDCFKHLDKFGPFKECDRNVMIKYSKIAKKLF